MQPVGRKRWSYFKCSEDFINKARYMIKVLDNAILGTDYIIPHNVRLRALREALDN